MIPKRSGREDQRPGGTLVRGEPYQGVPRRTQSCKKRTNKTAPARRNAETFQLAGAVLRSGQIRSASCRNFEEIAAAGTSAGGLRAAFPSFWVAPEAQRVGFRFLRKARRGFAPSIPTSLLKKAGPKTFLSLRKLILIQQAAAPIGRGGSSFPTTSISCFCNADTGRC